MEPTLVTSSAQQLQSGGVVSFGAYLHAVKLTAKIPFKTTASLLYSQIQLHCHVTIKLTSAVTAYWTSISATHGTMFS